MVAPGVVDTGDGVRLEQERGNPRLDLAPGEWTVFGRRVAAPAPTSTTSSKTRDRTERQRVELLSQLRVLPPARRSGHRHADLRVLADQGDLAPQVVPNTVQMRVELAARQAGRQRQVIHLGAHRPVGAGCPGERLHDQRIGSRRHQMHAQPLVRPSRVLEVERLQMPVRQAPRLHLVNRPPPRRLEIRRPGQPGPVDVGQPVQRRHDLRVGGGLLTNPPVHLCVDPLLRTDDHTAQHRRSEGKQDAFSHGLFSTTWFRATGRFAQDRSDQAVPRRFSTWVQKIENRQ